MLFRERQQIVILCLAGAMTSGFVLFRYLPLRKKAKAIEQRRTAQISAIARASTQREQLPELKEQLLKLQRTIGNYERQVPERRELGEFLQQATNLMNEHNLKGQLIQPDKEIKANGLNCIAVEMQCKGKLKQIFEFYRRMQGLDRLVRIERVEVANSGDFRGEVSMQTKAVIYYGED